VRVRRANPADISAMIDLEGQSVSAAHWSRSQYEALFVTATGQPSERLAWVAEDESAAAGIYAFLVARRVDAEWELENMVVAGTARRRGVGTLLLRVLVAHAKAERGSGIFLEVRESNQGARDLYRKSGFEETGLRKGYYTNPKEDAVLCRLGL
jgi:ribosomal-protein-alanine N-acetyltransferase